ncbi:MAG: hypothetical protein U0V75_12025 [Ferruginibacter sp.]
MSVQSKINWLSTGLGLQLLKRSLRKRLEGGGAAFMQDIPCKQPRILNRIDFILEECRNQKVLHVGFTDHPFTAERIQNKQLLHLQLKDIAAALYGIDADEPSVALYSNVTADKNVICADITKAYPDAVVQFSPQLILLGEVLEHLKNPHEAAEILYKSFRDGTKLLVTVPNYTALDNIAAALHQTESVHPHHYWHFSPYTLQKVFDPSRFDLLQLHFGMYYQAGKKINAVMQANPFYGDCIMAVFSINKKQA